MLAPKRPRRAESKFRVLYLGSDVKLMAAMRQMLTQPDYQVVACSDRDSAVLFLRSRVPYHLLLIDLEWRVKVGLKIARLAHSLRHRKRMPKILVSSSIALRGDLKALARTAGVNEWVRKSPEAGVVEVIRRMIEK